ncbi:hypothetical protein [Chondrinema litorale]|uniref:hypothetical protein n=1 Tax=Chondrinema litorale TaxID=2994555 RepID=UPI0025430B2C|nr:hypothetical protein [Chondrinema litorale]UZR94767.1 hypothetical protein OQ292_02920 [Chondrinema litorale]
MEYIITIVAIIMVFGIPITAIISSKMIEYKKLQLQGSNGISDEEKKLFKQMIAENAHLKSRIENLELIASDPDVLKLNSMKESEMEKQILELQHEIKKLKDKN